MDELNKRATNLVKEMEKVTGPYREVNPVLRKHLETRGQVLTLVIPLKLELTSGLMKKSHIHWPGLHSAHLLSSLPLPCSVKFACALSTILIYISKHSVYFNHLHVLWVCSIACQTRTRTEGSTPGEKSLGSLFLFALLLLSSSDGVTPLSAFLKRASPQK